MYTRVSKITITFSLLISLFISPSHSLHMKHCMYLSACLSISRSIHFISNFSFLSSSFTTIAHPFFHSSLLSFLISFSITKYSALFLFLFLTFGRSLSLPRRTSLSFAKSTECSSLAIGLSWKLPT